MNDVIIMRWIYELDSVLPWLNSMKLHNEIIGLIVVDGFLEIQLVLDDGHEYIVVFHEMLL